MPYFSGSKHSQSRSQRHFTTAKIHKISTADGTKKLQIVKAASFSPSKYPAFQHASDYCDDQMVVGAVSWMMLTTHKRQNNWCPNPLWKHTRMGCSAYGSNAPLKLHLVSFKQLTSSTKGSKDEQPQQAGPQIPTIWCSSLYNGDEKVQRCGGSVSLQLLDQVQGRWAGVTHATSSAESPLLMTRPEGNIPDDLLSSTGWFLKKGWALLWEPTVQAHRSTLGYFYKQTMCRLQNKHSEQIEKNCSVICRPPLRVFQQSCGFSEELQRPSLHQQVSSNFTCGLKAKVNSLGTIPQNGSAYTKIHIYIFLRDDLAQHYTIEPIFWQYQLWAGSTDPSWTSFLSAGVLSLPPYVQLLFLQQLFTLKHQGLVGDASCTDPEENRTGSRGKGLWKVSQPCPLPQSKQ